MSSNEIRQFITLVEGLGNVTEEQQTPLEVLTALFEGDQELAEGLLDKVKEKTVAWINKAKSVGEKALPSMVRTFDQTMEKVADKVSPEAAEDIKQQLDKQAGSNWKGDIGKIAAGLAVATALLSSPAQAQHYYQPHWQHPGIIHVPQHHHHHYRGAPPHRNHGGEAFVGSLLGSALGAIIGQQLAPREVYPHPGYGHPGYGHPGYLPPGTYIPVRENDSEIED